MNVAAFNADLVRGLDRPRYYATLFASAAARPHLFALFALAAEVGSVPDLVREPALGEIRLQWWRDAVEHIGTGEGGETPVLAGLADAIRTANLPVAPLLDLIDARRADLYADEQPDRGSLEGFLGETESVLFQMAALVLAPTEAPAVAEAAGHAGIAYGLTGRLATLARARLRGRAVLSSDMLADHGLDGHSMFVGERLPELVRAVWDACDFTIGHLDRAEATLKAAPAATHPAFLPLAAVRPLVRRIRAAGERLAREPILMPHLDMLVRITWRAIRLPAAA